MKKSFYYLCGITVFLISLAFTNVSSAEASDSNNLVKIDTSIVPDSYELEVLIDKNDPNKDDLVIFVDNHKYKIEDGKLVEDFTPTFTTYATEANPITLANGGLENRRKYVAKDTTVHTGSSGPTELREHKIIDDQGNVLNSILSKVASIGIQKTVTYTGYYTFSIQNFSATTQTFNWTITF